MRFMRICRTGRDCDSERQHPFPIACSLFLRLISCGSPQSRYAFKGSKQRKITDPFFLLVGDLRVSQNKGMASSQPDRHGNAGDDGGEAGARVWRIVAEPDCCYFGRTRHSRSMLQQAPPPPPPPGPFDENGSLDFGKSCDKASRRGFQYRNEPLRIRHVRFPNLGRPAFGPLRIRRVSCQLRSRGAAFLSDDKIRNARRGARRGGLSCGVLCVLFKWARGGAEAFAKTLSFSELSIVACKMDPSAVQQPQNTVAEVSHANSSYEMATGTSEENVMMGEPVAAEPGTSAQVSFGVIGDGVAARHGDLSLHGCSGLTHMDVDGNTGASHGISLHNHDEKLELECNDGPEQVRRMSELEGKNANADAAKELNASIADVELHMENSPLPEQSQFVKPDQNGTPTKLLLTTPVGANESNSNSGVARDTSSIPGISMLANQSIPVAVYKHEEVVASKAVFTDALNKFHTVLGTRLTKKGRGGRERAAEVKTFEESISGIPKLGGEDLDLHLLYVEVTSRGGLEQVIKDRKWKEVTNCFKFAETTTSASYILRKYYVGLLYYFEQSYFHKKTGPLIPPPISMPGPSPLSVKRGDSALGIAFTPTEGQPGFKRTRKRKILPITAIPATDPALSVGLTVRSTIEGKFEHGYLVSVTVGTEKMRGVIYHVPSSPMQKRGAPPTPPQHASIPNYEATMGAEPMVVVREEPSGSSLRKKMRRKRRRADDMPKKDPDAPRPNRTGYNFFFAEQRAKLKALHPEKDKELSRMIGDAWNKLTEDEKMPYQDRGVQDKERYQIEQQKYLEILKSRNGAVPTVPTEAGEKEKWKEAVVDAAIDLAVDVAVNNSVNVAVDDVVVDVAAKSVTTDAGVENHRFPAGDLEKAVIAPAPAAAAPALLAATARAAAVAPAPAAAPAFPAAPAPAPAPAFAAFAAAAPAFAVFESFARDEGGGTANTLTFPSVEVFGTSNNSSLDVDDGIPSAIGDAPDGSANLLAAMDFDIEPRKPDSAPHLYQQHSVRSP